MAYKKANAKESLEGRNDVRSGVPFLKLEAGKDGKAKRTWIRIMPPREDHPTDRWYHWVPVHHISVGGQSRQFTCPAQLDQGFCPICVLVQEARDSGKDEKAYEMSAKWHALINVVVIGEDGKPDGEVKVWAPGKRTFTDLLDEVEGLDEDEADISDPETGRDVSIRRRGTTQKDTRYEISLAPDPSRLPKVFIRDVLESDDGLHDLTTVYQTLDPKKADNLLASPKDSDPFEDDDEDVVEAEVRELPATSRRPRDDEEEEIEETKSTPPARSRSSANGSSRPAARRNGSKPSDEEDTTAAARERLRAAIALAVEEDDGDGDDEGDDE